MWTMMGPALMATAIRADRERPDPCDTRVASVALLLEVAHADDRFSRREQSVVREIVQGEFGLDGVRANRLVRAAVRVRDDAPGPWVFSRVLVEAFSARQRSNLFRLLNRLAEVDGGPTWRESYVLGQVGSLLRLETEVV